VFERSRVQLPAGALPGRLGQLSLPSLRGRYINRVPAGVKAGRVHSCRVAAWQVILCGPMWQVTPRSSRTSSRRGLYSALTFICFKQLSGKIYE